MRCENRKPRPHVVHIFPSFGIGGVPLRTVGVINHFNDQFGHTIIPLDHNTAAARSIFPELQVEFLHIRQSRAGLPGRVVNAGKTLKHLQPNLVITYNWGSIEWAMANMLIAKYPQIHFEDGFGKDEAHSQLRRRILFRRVALSSCSRVVVPSRTLEDIACHVWRLPRKHVTYIPNGVDITRFVSARGLPVPVVNSVNDRVVGTVAPFRPEKNLLGLLQAFADIKTSSPPRLIMAGDGAERASLEAAATSLGIRDRVVFTGHVAPEAVLPSFDVFAMSSDTEQLPITILEAMAAGRPIAAYDIGDIKSVVSAENREYIVPAQNVAALTAAIKNLLADPDKRNRIGMANQRRVSANFSQAEMLKAYEGLFVLGYSSKEKRI